MSLAATDLLALAVKCLYTLYSSYIKHEKLKGYQHPTKLVPVRLST